MSAMKVTGKLARNFEQLRRGDVASVGGKNSSLGEMICALAPEGIAVAPGFATTAEAYWHYVNANNILEKNGDAHRRMAIGKAALTEVGYAVRSTFQGETISHTRFIRTKPPKVAAFPKFTSYSHYLGARW
jgi:phosphoenolpyruvate synthase/pyruvate phosphate dikinase